jgi:hypothetical protein
MFQGLLKRAERSIDSAVTKVVDRALMAAPFVVAGGFATAALTVWLVEHYGQVTAYTLMAGAFALIGLITMAVLGMGNAAQASSESAASEPEQTANASDDADAASDMDLTALLTPEVRAILASAAPAAVPGIARGVTRNLPLILLLAVVGFVISRFTPTSSEPRSSSEPESPSERPPASPADVQREAPAMDTRAPAEAA